MPIFFLIIGIMLIIVAINNKLPALGTLAKSDFEKSGNVPGFGLWIVAIFAVGAIGYAKQLKPLANSFLVLIVIAMLLSNRGFFEKFTSAIQDN